MRDNALIQRINRHNNSITFVKYDIKRTISLIKDADPTINKIYSDWIAKLYTEKSVIIPEDTKKIKERLTQFTKLKNSPKFPTELKNIYVYKTYGDLAKTIDENLGNQSKKEVHKVNAINGVELVLTQEPYKVYKITSAEGASELCKGTDWCIKDPKFSSDYLQLGPLYLVFKDGIKFALIHFKSDQFMDVYDRPLPKEVKWELIDLLYPITGINQCSFPSLAYEYCYDFNVKNNEELEKIIANNAFYSCLYAIDVIKCTFPLGEPVIATDVVYSYHYAKYILKGRFRLGERVIATDAWYAYLYAKHTIKGRFLLGEPVIATNLSLSYDYAENIIKGRFLQGEEKINKDNFYKKI